MTCFVCIGCKTGDLLSAAPIIHHWFKVNNQKPAVMVSRQYAGVLDRMPYMTPVVYDGDWHDLAGALKLGKRRFNKTICLSTYGKDFPIEHRTASFVTDQYERANLLPLYDTLPLVIESGPRKSFARPTILFADHSHSSPFLQKQELYSLLKAEFPHHDVRLLSDVILPHFADFLSWYDNADALVTIETAHLHLSAATKTPTFALATDKPSRWHGSAWSKRFSYYCRYSEFEQRKGELIEAMKDTLAGVRKPEVLCLN